jgi:hypothetical protein
LYGTNPLSSNEMAAHNFEADGVFSAPYILPFMCNHHYSDNSAFSGSNRPSLK